MGIWIDGLNRRRVRMAKKKKNRCNAGTGIDAHAAELKPGHFAREFPSHFFRLRIGRVNLWRLDRCSFRQKMLRYRT